MLKKERDNGKEECAVCKPLVIIPACFAYGLDVGAVSWFWVMKKKDLLEEVNKGTKKPHGGLWYNAGRFAYVLCALILCLVALIKGIAF